MTIPFTKAPPLPPRWSGSAPSQLDRIEATQARMEGKLDALLDALAGDGDQDDPPTMTLDGDLAGEARPEGEPL
ncbi:hypothetical protein [Orrella dioscoreae]|uniref:Uncharacterized protein n=1 Tax=Orrella dioscoreae TaxID=1851544 RepID=A0A1C3K864_9BURK|nr:hypothetical protein [Orrella dioscoreae]SBT27547.1 hypothetical protein ODI_02449 [Orrella dioscoreae]SOE48096.1 hypothetical protein ODI_R1233 [Orrella dioscoreae]